MLDDCALATIADDRSEALVRTDHAMARAEAAKAHIAACDEAAEKASTQVWIKLRMLSDLHVM